MQRLEDGDLIALPGQIGGTGQTGRAGTHHGYLLTVGLGLLGHGVHILPVPVGDEALQTADGHGLTLDAPDAAGFALGLLGADAAGKGRQGVGGGDDLVGGRKVTLGNLLDEFGDAHIDGAALDALGILAVQAAAGLFFGHFRGIAQGDFLEVAGADLGVLLGHGGFHKSHIRHFRFLLT